jgi:hypothetical protein
LPDRLGQSAEKLNDVKLRREMANKYFVMKFSNINLLKFKLSREKTVGFMKKREVCKKFDQKKGPFPSLFLFKD